MLCTFSCAVYCHSCAVSVCVYFQSCVLSQWCCVVYFQKKILSRVVLCCVFSEFFCLFCFYLYCHSCAVLCIFTVVLYCAFSQLCCVVHFQSSLCRCITTMCWWNCTVLTVSLFSSTSYRSVPTLLFTDLFRVISLLFLVTEKKLVGGPYFYLLSALCFKVYFIATGMKYIK